MAACDALQSSPLAQWPDLLICDIALGEGEDGYSVVWRIRAIESAAKIALDQRLPAIALSGYNEAEDRARALVAGFQIHLGKPVDPAELIITIASMARAAPGTCRRRAFPPPALARITLPRSRAERTGDLTPSPVPAEARGLVQPAFSLASAL